MDRSDILRQLTDVFREALGAETLILTADMKAADVPGWNSQNEAILMVAIEVRFGIKFKTGEIVQLGNIEELVELIDEKLKKGASNGRPADFAGAIDCRENEAEIRTFILENFISGRAEELGDDEPLLDNLIESVGVLELISYLEERFAIVVTDKDMTTENLGSVKNIAAYVTRKLQRAS